ncbi:nucleotide pyrophosphohydrolase [Caldimonas thermodepolymerans]|jgi:Predicted pyrophosphatase|uniref:NTP pyrophosphatase (Non-canonical NTP hydrolase) n=1 Tax=Caldimonas thermodepolymerans TaxID=215580 RepID=A0AA46DC18_9BURK|nr:nucleotide pyrophosphohydrolase [Caldimonas thermodepolymerans]TCP05941.1 NTP pyrophosphatase (non-canonical NTP hydrolase) [Caldimonas thermodepolymerans]UZG44480.1 nucleotide pyrophosphohydrolase [Caldimonas thermodepolymerans]UZG48123.1 nucleotide pyrophosphohydrolase [Caldimonas thermodepolymerans]
MPDDRLQALVQRLREFSAARQWERYHSPKNLAMALAGETGELVAELQWLTEDESRAPEPERLQRIRDEAADVFIYLARLADALGIDLIEAAHAKMDRNEARFPAGSAPGHR